MFSTYVLSDTLLTRFSRKNDVWEIHDFIWHIICTFKIRNGGFKGLDMFSKFHLLISRKKTIWSIDASFALHIHFSFATYIHTYIQQHSAMYHFQMYLFVLDRQKWKFWRNFGQLPGLHISSKSYKVNKIKLGMILTFFSYLVQKWYQYPRPCRMD